MQLGKQRDKLMHADLDTICEEVLRLIKNQHNLLNELLEIPDLLKESSADDPIRTDSQAVKEWQELLNLEKQNVENREMTLAVIGTMKAGKSTTINAIVGLDILPNRNLPMTCLATLIRHLPGQKEPVLKFPKRKPIEEMINKIEVKLFSLYKENKLSLLDIYNTNDGIEVINNILGGKFRQIQNRYEGPKNISNFLKNLNDLMRLATDQYIKLNFPIQEYNNKNDLPTIEVEFSYLANIQQVNKGSFTLLDTPGPNEYKLAEQFTKIIRKQITSASAVLAVVDYSQLRGEAENTIRTELLNQIDYIDNRLFVLVNKFDQRRCTGDMEYDEVRQYILTNFLHNNNKKYQLPEERVYPVSSLHAYLSNRVMREIKAKGGLPSPDNGNEEYPWLEDFGKAALGVFWTEDIQNKKRVESAATELLRRSQFEQPITEVILKAASRAAFICSESANDRMLGIGEYVDKFLEARLMGLTESVENIHQLINNLAKSIKDVKNGEKEVEEASKTQEKYEDVKEKLKENLENYFKISEEELMKLENKRKLPPNNLQLEFSSEVEAKDVSDKIDKGIMRILYEYTQDLESKLKELSNHLEIEIPKTVEKKVGVILEEAAKKLNNDRFSILFTVPELHIEDDFLDLGLVLESSIQERIEQKPTMKKRKVDNFFWGSIPRFFGNIFNNDDWGYETSIGKNNVTCYVVDIKLKKENCFNKLDNNFTNFTNNSQGYFNEILKPVLDQYFNNLKIYLERFRGDLKDSLAIHKMSAKEQLERKERISELINRVELHKKLVKSIKQTVKQL
jgi:GTPase SAR1 family protein